MKFAKNKNQIIIRKETKQDEMKIYNLVKEAFESTEYSDGSEQYYSRMGYIQAENLGVEVPEEFPSINFMAIDLQEKNGLLKGSIRYPEEFGL